MRSCGPHTFVVWSTQAGVVAHTVHTGGAILTAVILTVVHVYLAEGAMEAKCTSAAVEQSDARVNHGS